MTEANEDYGDGDDDESGEPTGASGESTGESSGALTGASGALTDESIASLGSIPGIIAPPSTIAPTATAVNRVGTVARFALPPSATPPTSSPPSDDDDFDLSAMGPNAQEHDIIAQHIADSVMNAMDQDDQASRALSAMDPHVNAIITRSIADSVNQAVGSENAGYGLDEIIASMINPVDVVDDDPLGTLIRRMGCTNREQTRAYLESLLQSFITTMDHNDQVALRRMLRRLNRILNRRVRVRTINGRRNRTIRYSMQFINILGRFGCRTERARRMLYAFLNELRQRIVFRLRETRSRRQAPSTASKLDMQGGKNRSKSHKTQRCKSHKRNKRYSRKH